MSIASPVPRRQLPPAVNLVREASGPTDMAIVRELDDAAFPATSQDQQRATRGELEDGVAAGDVYLLERDAQPVAYLHLDRRMPGLIYVSGLAVRPDVQGGGLGRLMIDHFLRSMEARPPTEAVVTVTSPRNLAMLSLLFPRGFAARWSLRDFFGPGRDRLGCQLRVAAAPTVETVHLMAAAPLHTVFSLMEEQQHVIRSLIQTDSGPYFAMSPEQPGEFLDCAPPGSWP